MLLSNLAKVLVGIESCKPSNVDSKLVFGLHVNWMRCMGSRNAETYMDI